MTTTKNPPRKAKAVDHLKRSQLKTKQLALMGAQVDLKEFYLTFSRQGHNILGAVSDIVVHRTIEGASTVTVTVPDQDLKLLRSGLLAQRQDTQIDGLYFRLVGFKLNQGRQLELTFEEREIAVLRTYDKPIKQSISTSRASKTRAEFALRMLREIKELPPIPYFIPELKLTQPIGADALLPEFTSNDRNFGIPKKNDLNVKGTRMTEEQRRNAETVLAVGASRVLPRSLLVMAMMTAIQESAIKNLRQPLPGDGNFLSVDPRKNPVGVFQQIKAWGWPASRDVATDAGAFYDKLGQVTGAANGSSLSYYQAIEKVQHSGNALAYSQWRTEAERIVTAYGVTSGSAADSNAQHNPQGTGSGDYEFYRGIPPGTGTQRKKGKSGWGKENSWACMQRLAQEVQWRAFFVSGIFYFLSDDVLLKSKPIATVTADDAAMLQLEAEYDEGKKNGSVTLTCLIARWAAPPGSVVQIDDLGPLTGRWLVNDVERSTFKQTGTIVLKKALPRLPEPSGSNLTTDSSGTWTGAPTPQDPPSQRQYKVGTGLVQPIPPGYHDKIVQGPHPTDGLTNTMGFGPHDWYAIDFGADAGAPVLAVENGTIYKISGHDPSDGPWDPELGVHGPFGLSFYLKGDSGSRYYYTHLGSRFATEGLRVSAGQQMGTVGNYAKWGGVNHVHVGVLPGSSGRPDDVDLMNAPKAAA